MAIERRLSAERRTEAREDPDRRRTNDVRLAIPTELSRGWLTLEGASTKVRVAPIPEGWMALTDEQLIALAQRAAR